MASKANIARLTVDAEETEFALRTARVVSVTPASFLIMELARKKIRQVVSVAALSAIVFWEFVFVGPV